MRRKQKLNFTDGTSVGIFVPTVLPRAQLSNVSAVGAFYLVTNG